MIAIFLLLQSLFLLWMVTLVWLHKLKYFNYTFSSSPAPPSIQGDSTTGNMSLKSQLLTNLRVCVKNTTLLFFLKKWHRLCIIVNSQTLASLIEPKTPLAAELKSKLSSVSSKCVIESAGFPATWE